MPFKGDMRLGGARRNDSTMNGMTEGPNFLPYGTILSVQHQVPYATGSTYSFEYTAEGNTYIATGYNQRCSVNVIADGAGGSLQDWGSAFNVEFMPNGQYIQHTGNSLPVYVTIDATNYQVGYSVQILSHDGYGGVSAGYLPNTYQPSGTFIVQLAGEVKSTYMGTEYTVGNGYYDYYTDGSGGYYRTLAWANYTYAGAFIADHTYTTYVTLPDYNNYPNGSNTDRLLSNGLGGFSVEPNYSFYREAYGTYIVSFNSAAYYHDGTGYYYTESGSGGGDSGGSGGGGYAPYGTTTGNTSGGTNYISINGNSYENGSYSSTEYHDGNGGTYWESSTSYASYGTQFFNESYTDEYGNTSYTYYYSDGNGSYYTGS